MKQVMQPTMLVERRKYHNPVVDGQPTNSKTDFTETHKRNILRESRATPSTIKPGHIIRFNYRGVKNSKNVHEPRPLVLVLNPRYKGHLHGIALRQLSPRNIKQLANLVRDSIADKAAKYLKLRLPRLRANINDPYKFYHNTLKKFLDKNVKLNPYRTYINSGITSITIVDYKFESMDKKTQREVIRKEVSDRKEQSMTARDKILSRREKRQALKDRRKAELAVSKNLVTASKKRRATRRAEVLKMIKGNK